MSGSRSYRRLMIEELEPRIAPAGMWDEVGLAQALASVGFCAEQYASHQEAPVAPQGFFVVVSERINVAYESGDREYIWNPPSTLTPPSPPPSSSPPPNPAPEPSPTPVSNSGKTGSLDHVPLDILSATVADSTAHISAGTAPPAVQTVSSIASLAATTTAGGSAATPQASGPIPADQSFSPVALSSPNSAPELDFSISADFDITGGPDAGPLPGKADDLFPTGTDPSVLDGMFGKMIVLDSLKKADAPQTAASAGDTSATAPAAPDQVGWDEWMDYFMSVYDPKPE